MNNRVNFDTIARPYRALEYVTLGRKLEETRLNFLSQLKTARKALVLGDGDGRFLARLLAENQTLEATAVDGSAVMLDLLHRRCRPYESRLRIIRGDALELPFAPDGSYDLVVTHFFLDCFTEAQLNRLITKILPAMQPGARWLVSDFRIPSGNLHLPAKALVRGLYLAFRLLTGLRVTRLPDHAGCLSAAGLQRVDRRMFLSGILTTELWERKDHTSRAQSG